MQARLTASLLAGQSPYRSSRLVECMPLPRSSIAPSVMSVHSSRIHVPRHSLHYAAAVKHVHGPNCSHSHAHPSKTTVTDTITAATAASASSIPTSSADGSAASPDLAQSSGRRPPPVLAKGEMPAGDNPLLPGWYQRPLPLNLIPFSSNRGKQIFKEAMNAGDMEGYFALAEQFSTQSTPSYCGPGTLAMVLNALALDPKRLWKGNWRWFSEEMLETCDIRKPQDEPLAGVDQVGLSFEEFLFLAECNGSHVRAFRAEQASLSKFRAAIATACSRTDLHVVASFSRKVLGQTGSGHYSPIGGYHADLDLALVLDVARFKYPPYWAPVPLLWQAVCDIDDATGKRRGYYLMSKGKLASAQTEETTIFTPLSSACRIAVDKESWSRLAEHFCSVLPLQLQQQYADGYFHGPSSTDGSIPTAEAGSVPSSTSPPQARDEELDAQSARIFREILTSLPVELSSIFMMYTHDLNQRMVNEYQQKEQAKREAAESHNHPANGSADSNGCNSTDSCQVHSTLPSLSVYHSLLPKHTPHNHVHSIPAQHALQPLLHAIASTRMFALLQKHGMDLSTLEFKQRANINGNNLNNAATQSKRAALHLLAGTIEGELELACLLLLACPEQIFSALPPRIQSHLSTVRVFDDLPMALQIEVRNLRSQMGILAEFCRCGAAHSVVGNDNPNVDPADVAANRVAADQREQHRALKHVVDELHATQQLVAEKTAISSSSKSTGKHVHKPKGGNGGPVHRFVGAPKTKLSSMPSKAGQSRTGTSGSK